MSSNHINNHNRQRYSEMTSHHSSINNNDHIYQVGKLTSIVLLVGTTSLALLGCQSSPAVSSPAASKSMIDFSTADRAQSQAQGRAFNASLTAKAERYQQLFDQEKYPNTDNQAKSHLLSAIRQHLATEHVAVAQANYQAVPFIDPDSIDAGSSSLLRTIIEAYVYKPDGDYDESDYEDRQTEAMAELAAVSAESNKCNDNEDDDAYEVCVVEDVNYDENGYSRSDYQLESYGEGNYDTDDYESDSAFSKLSKLNPKSMIEQYEAIQTAKQQPEAVEQGSQSATSTGVIGQMLSMFHRTPEQIAASNAYQYQNLTFNSVSQYKPKQRQLQSVYSYDYVTPTISSSIQIPLAFDFNHSTVTVDPSAIMPIVALVNPENTPLPNQMTSHTVSFGLPESITAQLPPAVLYDAAIAAIQSSMAELAPEHFSAVDIRSDAFAKEVGASRAVKVYFGSKQSGEMIGKTLKYMTKSLQDYVDANPQKYPDGAMLKTVLAKVQLYNKGYQSADVGSLLQLIEAIGPISFNQINYYYLDRSDRLLAKQQRVNIGGDLMGSTTSVLNQIRYDKSSFNNHALTPLLAESFGANAKTAIDGNAWMAEQRQQKDRLQTARDARYDYSGSSDDYNDDDYSSDYADGDSGYEAAEYDSADSQDDTDIEDDADNRVDDQ
ncbi:MULTISPECIES: hypothetical protein [unclassified Psychrobacter]|uniref:hypothetical protein n=1 Tax=unclassified Psychrobacter TaxID=196806 RepID=UPI000EEBF266|nr:MULTISPECIES: hypothetical protein [unclassified Psychrobacter]MBE8610057.1 hypothetical protein [Pseudomonas lundensis]HCI76564.1 hypothetical protein [Psychrobacter sp.]